MAEINIVENHVIYEPSSATEVAHGSFPGLAGLGGDEIIALFVVGTSLEATDATTCSAYSSDGGRTWNCLGPIHQKDSVHQYAADAMKPTMLRDGRLIAIGYRFHRDREDDALVNAATGGVRPGDNLVAFSEDRGRSWTSPKVILRSRPELIETSGPAVQLSDGTLMAAGSLFPTWEGKRPSGHIGVLLKSCDGGQTWYDHAQFFNDPSETLTPSETRLCEMQPGRLVALMWMADHKRGVNKPNHIAVSRDGGCTWSSPISIHVPGQASNLIHWRDDLLLSIHAQREGRDIGVFVRLVDFKDDQWLTVKSECIWGNATSMNVGAYSSMGQNLRFGQPSLLRLNDTEVLATHWAIEEGKGRILTHRLVVSA